MSNIFSKNIGDSVGVFINVFLLWDYDILQSFNIFNDLISGFIFRLTD